MIPRCRCSCVTSGICGPSWRETLWVNCRCVPWPHRVIEHPRSDFSYSIFKSYRIASQVLDVPCTVQKRGGTSSSGASTADRRTLVTVKISSTKSNAGPPHAPAARPHASMTDSPLGRVSSFQSASSGMPALSLASSASILDDADLDLYSKTAITVFVVRHTVYQRAHGATHHKFN
jgi:hypothetical protein